MSLGNCPYCGWIMRVKAVNPDGTVFTECSNPNCDNKWGDQVWECTVTVNE